MRVSHVGRLLVAALTMLGAFAGLAFGPAGRAGAQSPDDIDTLSTWNGSSTAFNFGPGATPTYGQVITAPADGAPLTGFEFEVNLPATVTFRAHVYAWNGTHATGASLYDSPPRSTTGSNYQLVDIATVDIATGDIGMTPGDQYVLFLSTFQDESGHSGSGPFAAVAAPYTGGEFVYLNDFAGGASGWTTEPWSSGCCDIQSLAFRATFGTVSGPTISVGDTTARGASAPSKVYVPLTLSSPQPIPVSVQVDTSSPGSPGSTQTVTIPSGATSLPIGVSIPKTNGGLPVTQIQVTLSDPVGATLGRSAGLVTVDNLKSSVGLWVTDVIATDTVSGSPVVAVAVELAARQATPVTVNWATRGNQGSDAYHPASGTLTIPASSTSARIPLTLRSATQERPFSATQERQFTVVLSDPSGTTIASGTGQITVLPAG